MGRPSIFTPELGASICERIAQGESLRSVCRDEGMPALSTVLRWLSQDSEFQGQYARAKEESAEAHADEILDICDSEPDVQRARLKVDTRKWIASKLKPKKYGDRIEHEHGGAVAHYVVEVPTTVDPNAWISKYSGGQDPGPN